MYDELIQTCRNCVEALCGECKYKHLLKPGNFVTCTNALITEATDAIEELQATVEGFKCNTEMAFVREGNKTYLRFFPRWSPVTERLPEMNTSCLLYNKYYGPMVGARIDEMRFRIPGSRFPDTPTHWMPLPEPPKEDKS